MALREQLVVAGTIHHDHVFFHDSGEPFASLVTPAKRWRATLNALKLRYRRPYIARHSSVSWNLMIGTNALWVCQAARTQHRDDAACLRRLGGWCGRIGYRGH